MRGIFDSNGNNLIGKADGSTGFANNVNGDLIGTIAAPINALLGALASNGGATKTHALLMNSPAFNAGNDCVTEVPLCQTPALMTDQRGSSFVRKIGAAVDIGAFEGQAAPTAAPVSVSGRVTSASGKPVSRVVVSLTDSGGNGRSAATNPFGYFRFEEVPAGATFIAEVRHKFYQFTPQIVTTLDDIDDLNFVTEF